MEPNEKIIHDAVQATDRLGGNKGPTGEYEKLVYEYGDLMSDLDVVIKDDTPLDPVTGLRSALDQIERMTQLPYNSSTEERVAHVLERIILPDPRDQYNSEQLSIEAQLAINMIRNFGYLVAAIRDRDNFIANNASEHWEDDQGIDLLFKAAYRAGELLPWIAEGDTIEAQIQALQNHLYEQLTGKLITQSSIEARKKNRVKIILDTIMGPKISHKDRYGWD